MLPPPRNTRTASLDRRELKREPLAPAPPPPSADTSHEEGNPSTSDFVKKLFKMLEDPAIAHVVSWGPAGDCFVVKDMNEFTKSILPRMFKHSNFASFVRQLNKYDFHKVKNTDENQFGEHSWTFRHPDFHADRPEMLENIKRKVPTQRKPGPSASSSSAAAKAVSGSPSPAGDVEMLRQEVDRLAQENDDMKLRMRDMEARYESVLGEIVRFQGNMAQQDGVMKDLIQYFLQLESGKLKAAQAAQNAAPQAAASGAGPSNLPRTPDGNPFLPTTEAQRLVGQQYPESDVARASLLQMNEISRRAENAGMSFDVAPGPQPNGASVPLGPEQASALARIQEYHRRTEEEAAAVAAASAGPSSTPADAPGPSAGPASRPALTPGSEPFLMPSGAEQAGLQVFTVGSLLPRSTTDAPDGTWSYDPTQLSLGLTGVLPQLTASVIEDEPGPSSADGDLMAPGPSVASASGSASRRGSAGAEVARPGSTLRVRRSTFVPGWAVPPKVLLVDDDAVNRKLSSKFLQVFGCTTDVAVDGVSAVHKMNLEKYDLVLMDIVMPKLDGVSATNMIRQFDHMTPIISMTGASKPNDIMTYYSSGMNDILAKPFTKEGLFEMLDKHLMHLKTFAQMNAKIPRALTPSGAFDALSLPGTVPDGVTSSSDATGTGEGKINPLAAFNMTEEQYGALLQTMLSEESFSGVSVGVGGIGKRALEDGSMHGDGREKRQRFEVVE